MSKTLPIAWISLAILAGLATIFVQIAPLLDDSPLQIVDGVMSGFAVSGRLASYALVYLLIEKCAPNPASRGLGWGHLALTCAALAFELGALVSHAREGLRPGWQDVPLFGYGETLSRLARIGAAGLFFLAILMAIRNAPKLIRRVSF